MRQEREESRQEGLSEGFSKGLSEGLRQEILKNKRELVIKKLMKGKPLAVIADKLEENTDVIQALIEEIQKDSINNLEN